MSCTIVKCLPPFGCSIVLGIRIVFHYSPTVRPCTEQRVSEQIARVGEFDEMEAVNKKYPTENSFNKTWLVDNMKIAIEPFYISTDISDKILIRRLLITCLLDVTIACNVAQA